VNFDVIFHFNSIRKKFFLENFFAQNFAEICVLGGFAMGSPKILESAPHSPNAFAA